MLYWIQKNSDGSDDVQPCHKWFETCKKFTNIVQLFQPACGTVEHDLIDLKSFD